MEEQEINNTAMMFKLKKKLKLKTKTEKSCFSSFNYGLARGEIAIVYMIEYHTIELRITILCKRKQSERKVENDYRAKNFRMNI